MFKPLKMLEEAGPVAEKKQRRVWDPQTTFSVLPFLKTQPYTLALLGFKGFQASKSLSNHPHLNVPLLPAKTCNFNVKHLVHTKPCEGYEYE